MRYFVCKIAQHTVSRFKYLWPTKVIIIIITTKSPEKMLLITEVNGGVLYNIEFIQIY